MATASQIAASSQLYRKKREARNQGRLASNKAIQQGLKLMHPVDSTALSSFNEPENQDHVALSAKEEVDNRVGKLLDDRDRVGEYNRRAIDSARASMIPDYGIADRIAEQKGDSADQQKRLEEYGRLGNLLSGKLSDQKRRRTESKRSKLYSQIQSNLESVEKMKELKRKWTIAWEAYSVGSTVEWEGATGWVATIGGFASESLQILKLILGKETLFTKWEPEKLDLTKPDAYVVFMHFGMFIFLFLGAIFTVGQAIFAFFGAILLQLAWIAPLAGVLYTAVTYISG